MLFGLNYWVSQWPDGKLNLHFILTDISTIPLAKRGVTLVSEKNIIFCL